ncbi:hypothetical protein [Haloarchaeobius sp. TZWWS8]|uniref:hypothetical protein n=1 Tax=Haloarchaeobius sp. TZWWS8 TaxID=3446121 RepID=UPI003EBCA62E
MTRVSRVSRGQLLLLLVLLSSVVLFGLESGPRDGASPESRKSPDDVSLKTVHDGGTTALWPYTSRAQRFESLTLPVNVVVREDPDLVRAMLTRELSGSDVDEQSDDALPSLGEVPWRPTHGATRYTYVRNLDDGSGQWADEYSQLHVGTYLGTRQHVRLYRVPAKGGTVTAIQAHREHWDWFRLRHTVGSTSAGQVFVERQFYGARQVQKVTRERYGNGGILDADGWVTVVNIWQERTPPAGVADDGSTGPSSVDPREAGSGEAVPLGSFGVVTGTVAVVGLAASNVGDLQKEASDALERLRADWSVTRNHILLFASLAALPLVVRAGAVAIEETGIITNPKHIAGVFYPLLVLGLPLCAYRFAADLGFAESALIAVLGFGTGIVADYTYIGIAFVPREILVQRLVLALTLGIVAAAGSVRLERRWRENELLAAGAVCWAAAVVWPLLSLL